MCHSKISKTTTTNIRVLQMYAKPIRKHPIRRLTWPLQFITTKPMKKATKYCKRDEYSFVAFGGNYGDRGCRNTINILEARRKKAKSIVRDNKIQTSSRVWAVKNSQLLPAYDLPPWTSFYLGLWGLNSCQLWLTEIPNIAPIKFCVEKLTSKHREFKITKFTSLGCIRYMLSLI